MHYNRQDINVLVTNAFLVARKNESKKRTQLEFAIDLEKNISRLSYELDKRIWKPSESMCFVVTEPTVREVFAPEFRDRVVSHVLCSLVSQIFERTFVYDSYSCRAGKGTQFGIERLEHHIRSETNNYQEEAYALSMDIEGYFLHINKTILLNETLRIFEKAKKDERNKNIDFDFVEYLTRTLLANNPAVNCKKISSQARMNLVKPYKSLFNSVEGTGLAIGDIMSQWLSNVYLNMLDQYCKRELKARHYCRYVDDFKIISKDKDYLIFCENKIRAFLKDELGLTLHREKTKITSCRDNLFFLGACIRNGRSYVPNKVLRRIERAFAEVESYPDDAYKLSVINSYLGYLSNFSTFKFRKMLCEKYIANLGLFMVRANYTSVCFIE